MGDFSIFSQKQLGSERLQLIPRLVDLEPVIKLVNLERLSLMDNPVTKAGTLLEVVSCNFSLALFGHLKMGNDGYTGQGCSNSFSDK